MDKFKKTNTIIMNTILHGWNFIRILRLVLGIIIAIQGIVAGEMITIILGLFFAGMSVANIGCCGATGCSVNPCNSLKNKSKKINYEEVDTFK